MRGCRSLDLHLFFVGISLLFLLPCPLLTTLVVQPHNYILCLTFLLSRMLFYVAGEYEKLLGGMQADLYGYRRIRLPKPEFYIVYTGREPQKNNKFFQAVCTDMPILQVTFHKLNQFKISLQCAPSIRFRRRKRGRKRGRKKGRGHEYCPKIKRREFSKGNDI